MLNERFIVSYVRDPYAPNGDIDCLGTLFIDAPNMLVAMRAAEESIGGECMLAVSHEREVEIVEAAQPQDTARRYVPKKKKRKKSSRRDKKVLDNRKE